MHRSRIYRNPAMYHPRAEIDPPRFVYGAGLNQTTRNAYKRNSVTLFSPANRRDVPPYTTKHPTYGNPRFPDRSKYVWTANKQQQPSQAPSNPSSVSTSSPSTQLSIHPSPSTPTPSSTSLSVPKQALLITRQVPARLSLARNNGSLSKRELSCLKVTALDDPNTVAIDIASKLREEKVYIIRKVVDVLGVKKAIKLYYETKDKESKGGILIQNGKRRRTPGGVYLTLLRESIPKQDADKVFLEIKRHESKLKIAHYKMF